MDLTAKVLAYCKSLEKMAEMKKISPTDSNIFAKL